MSPQPSAGVSGMGLAVVAAGGIMAYSAIINSNPVDVLRALLLGKSPTSRPSDLEPARAAVTGALGKAVGAAAAGLAAGAAAQAGGAVPAAGPLGERIVAAARTHLGAPYVFGAHGPDKFDCSGLVTYVLVHDVGLRNLPNNTHTVTGQFLVWSGAQTVGRPPAPGDLICWPGHIGIATSATHMIAAPTYGVPVREQKIWWTPEPLVRRVKG